MTSVYRKSLRGRYRAHACLWGTSLAGVILFTGPAWGQEGRCAPRVGVLAQLAQQYHEAPVAIGHASNGNLVEVLTTVDGATWTIIQTSPTGMSCLVGAGEDWQRLKPAQPAETPL